MSINIAFYGSKCFDLLHYVSRVLKACNISSIMIDWSVDQSLYKSIPNPGIQENEVIDYRGVDVSTNYRKSMSFDYDVIFITSDTEYQPNLNIFMRITDLL